MNTKAFSRFCRTLRRGAMCLLVLFMVQAALAPKPAEAYWCDYDVDGTQSIEKWFGSAWEWVKQWYKEGMLEYYLNQISTTYKDMKKKYEELTDTLGRNGMLANFGQRTSAQIMADTEEYIANAKTHMEVINEQAKYLAAHEKPRTHIACKSILAARGAPSVLLSQREIARAMFDSLQARARCPTCGGTDYMVTHLTQTMKMGYGDALDGLEASGSLASIEGSDGSPLAGADLAPPRESLILELPKFEKKEYEDPDTGEVISVMAADMTSARPGQRMFMAQWDRLFTLLMDRPTPRSGEMMATEIGLFERQAFNQCAVTEASLIKPCVDFDAYFARPDRDDKSNEAQTKREQQKAFCATVQDAIDLTPYDNCQYGLSPQEEHEISFQFCKTLAFAVGGRASGASPAEEMEGSDMCTSAWLSWRIFVETQRNLCTKGAAKLRAARQCYNDVVAVTRQGKEFVSHKKFVPKGGNAQVIKTNSAAGMPAQQGGK